ncbi:MAG: crotonase/enoyl-CoA hydratase family protein [Proteobacteria bacterium]|nr:crotonase/enoyl-CoA hydratase family protein [Pseudomonadota bacterium]
MSQLADLTVRLEHDGPVAVLALCRPRKRNAVNDAVIKDLQRCLDELNDDTRVIVVCGDGSHFCAGLDLAEHVERTPFEVVELSRRWHATLDQLQFGKRPVVSALQGAVIGGGLEIALACHVRVAEPSTFYQLPEGRRGIFVGGGGSLRVPQVIGTGRTVEMMLTGRKYNASEGLQLGLSHYLVDKGAAFAETMILAKMIADNSAISNYLILNVLPRIADSATASGLMMESLAAALAQTGNDAAEGIRAFMERRAPAFNKR